MRPELVERGLGAGGGGGGPPAAAIRFIVSDLRWLTQTFKFIS